MNRLRHILLLSTALLPLGLGLGLAPAAAGPDGPNVVGGAATIQNPGSANVIVNQHTDRAIINWRLFDVGANERVRFDQPNSSSVILNRVTGGLGPSQILGHLDANGRVFVVNRDGILFGPNSVVNTAGFLATTSDIKNEDFMAGRYQFNTPGRPDASIVNLGTITATSGGFAALVAPGVRNSGTITATLGTVGLAAGNNFSLDFYGDRLITLAVGDQISSSVKDVATGLPLKSLVTNDGAIRANGGRVELTAAAARQVVDSVINTSGVIEANTVGTRNGMIVLGAATAATKPAGTPKQTVKVSGTIKAAGKRTPAQGGEPPGSATGGTVIVTGENIVVAGATIDVTGNFGGGKVLIGGDWGGGKPDTSLVSHPSAKLETYTVPTATTVSVDAATRIDASAGDRGNGGKVVLWADGHLSFTGTILALGGTQIGRGGFIETSGKSVGISGLINGGKGGLWLLDPANVTVDSTLATTAMTALNAGTDYIIETGTTPGGGDGDIIFNSGVQINWNTSATLTLAAYRDIKFNDGVGGPTPGNLVNTGAGHLVMRADRTGIGIGTIDIIPITNPTRINWTNSTGSVSIFYNPTAFGTQDNFSSGSRILLASPSQLTQYMLVNDATNLQNIATNLAGTYALGRDIDASGPFAPIGSIGSPFTGILEGAKLDGGRYTISNLTVAPTSPTVTGVGLFGAIGANGSVQNVIIDSASILANPNAPVPPGHFIGVLAGQNFGTVANVSVTNSTISNNTVQSGLIAGGLIGQNAASGLILGSTAGVNVTVGDATLGSNQNNAGGLVGVNLGTITSSSATGNIFGGAQTALGGLVGRNETGATIHLSNATGNVNLGPNSTQSVAGGLVGFNFGSITDSFANGQVTGGGPAFGFSTIIGGLVGINDVLGTINNSLATGAVIGGTNSEAGGFVGTNNGSITNSHATGAVSSTDGMAGGFVAFNQFSGIISNSTATGVVTGGGFNTGGFVAENWGLIEQSTASGNVTSTTMNAVGGFAGDNIGTLSFVTATGNVNSNGGPAIGGLAGINIGDISDSSATGNVTVTSGTFSTAGGLVGLNAGNILRSSATGLVNLDSSVGFAGGLVGFNIGSIAESNATGSVTAGAAAFVGGLVGINMGDIGRSFATGAVTAGDAGFVGGLVGFNIGYPGFAAGTISQSYALGAVTGGAFSYVGGLAGVNLGSIDQAYAAGLVTGGLGSTTGGLVALASLPTGFDPGVLGGPAPPDLPTIAGTATNSYWDRTTTGQANSAGGTAQTTAQLTSGPPSGFDPSVWNSSPGFYPCLSGSCTPPPLPGPPAPNQPVPDHHDQHDLPNANILSPQIAVLTQLMKDVDLTTTTNDALPNTTTVTTTAPNAPRPPGPAGHMPSWYGPNAILPSGMPALNETRFASNEVLLQLRNATPEAVAALARQLGLEVITSQSFDLLGRTVYRFRITSGRSVREVIAALERSRLAAQALPSYVFELAQAPASDSTSQGNPAQYIVAKWRLADVHKLARGTNVRVAVIDSAIDSNHPDLAGVIVQRFDAVGAEETPHPHGTGMAGAIASHGQVLGVAPGARLLAIRAFGVSTGGAQGVSMNIVKGLEWAVKEGAQVINMSFAGPRDPILEQTIKALREKGIILIAAAGNAGPKSPPLYPGADPNVIAVTATDMDDKVFVNANRGKYVAVAAPGVEILVPAPDGSYQVTTGTSVAAAHVSGVAALLLERNPRLKPDELKKLLTSTAAPLKGRPEEVGAGLVDPTKALSRTEPKTAAAQ